MQTVIKKGRACPITWIPEMPVNPKAPGPTQDWILMWNDRTGRIQGRRKKEGGQGHDTVNWLDG